MNIDNITFVQNSEPSLHVDEIRYQGCIEEDQILTQHSNATFQVTWLTIQDYNHGYLSLVDNRITQQQFEKKFFKLFPREKDSFKLLVLKHADICIGTGSLFIDKDTTFDLITGYIEDIIVLKPYWTQSSQILNAMIDIAWYQGCEKCQVNQNNEDNGI